MSALVAAVSDPSLGATTVFLGSVRRGPEDGAVEEIDYSAYEEMLELEFGRITEETTARWPGARLAVVHRLGRVPAGEPSIAVAAGAPHRAEAFAACRHAIEEAKARLPVWKKEILAGGATRWRENEPPESGAEPRTA